MFQPWILIALGGMVLGGVVIFLVTRNERHRAEAQKEVQLTLLNKFSSGDEMASFLATDEGSQFIDRLAARPEQDPRKKTVDLITGACVTAGIAVGLGTLAVLGVWSGFFVVPALANAGISLGLFAAAGFSHWVSKRTGLIKVR